MRKLLLSWIQVTVDNSRIRIVVNTCSVLYNWRFLRLSTLRVDSLFSSLDCKTFEQSYLIVNVKFWSSPVTLDRRWFSLLWLLIRMILTSEEYCTCRLAHLSVVTSTLRCVRWLIICQRITVKGILHSYIQWFGCLDALIVCTTFSFDLIFVLKFVYLFNKTILVVWVEG